MQIDIGMVGTTEAGLVLDELAAQAETIQTTVFPAIIADFERISLDRFANQGPGWAPLSDTTREIKARRGYGSDSTQPLLATGALMYSLAGTTGHTVREITPDSLLMGTDVPYAQFHQDGPREIQVFGRGKATLPARPVVDISEATAQRWIEMVAAALTQPGRVSSSAVGL